MAGKTVQEAFGESIISAIREFAKEDMESVAELQTSYLSHVADHQLKKSLAETLYGARWIYKLGLALLVQDEEQMAHVRCQLIDYAAVCEGVLFDMILHAMKKRIMRGAKHKYDDPNRQLRPITWPVGRERSVLGKRSLWWLIEIAADETIVKASLQTRLHWLRNQRNTVHIGSRTHHAFLNTSKKAFDIMGDLFRETRSWKTAHP